LAASAFKENFSTEMSWRELTSWNIELYKGDSFRWLAIIDEFFPFELLEGRGVS